MMKSTCWDKQYDRNKVHLWHTSAYASPSKWRCMKRRNAHFGESHPAYVQPVCTVCRLMHVGGLDCFDALNFGDGFFWTELLICILRLGLVLILGEQLDEIPVLLGTTNKQADALSRCFGMYYHGIFASKLLILLHSSFVVTGVAEWNDVSAVFMSTRWGSTTQSGSSRICFGKRTLPPTSGCRFMLPRLRFKSTRWYDSLCSYWQVFGVR